MLVSKSWPALLLATILSDDTTVLSNEKKQCLG